MISATASEKKEVLQAITFGKPTAEEEGKDLSAYFVETDQWHKIFAGDIDVVYGPKGAGKSALYALLLSRTSELFDRGIIVVPAENPRGAVAFRDLVSNPPADESEFRNLWKLFFLVLVAHTLRDYGISSAHLRKVIDCLEEARLLPRNVSLHALLRSAFSYVRRIMRGDAVAFETTVGVDPMNSAPSLTGRIRFVEPTGIEESLGCVSVEQLLEWTNLALEEAGFRVWLVLDRLDVAFAESADLERNALRALFRVYLDLRRFNAIALKIFLRTDIWMNILRGGFREASHISSQMTISWDEASLLNLVIRRAIHNKALREFYAVEVQEVLADRGRQVELFYRIFPRRVHSSEQARSFEWILQNTCDGSRRNSPRELIHLLSVAQRLQLRRMEIGQAPPDGESLFESPSLVRALPEVSRVRYEQTLCAEYPQLRERMQQLENEKSLQTPSTLATIWRLNLNTALETAYQLVDIGFFQFKGTRHSPEFKVPLLYQRALKMRSLR